MIIYLFIYIYIYILLWRECSPLWESYFEKRNFLSQISCFMGKKHQKKKENDIFIFKIAKNRHNRLQYEWVAIKIFYFHIWILPDLAKCICEGWLPLEERKKMTTIKIKIKINCALSLSRSLFYLLSFTNGAVSLRTPGNAQFLSISFATAATSVPSPL